MTAISGMDWILPMKDASAELADYWWQHDHSQTLRTTQVNTARMDSFVGTGASHNEEANAPIKVVKPPIFTFPHVLPEHREFATRSLLIPGTGSRARLSQTSEESEAPSIRMPSA